MNTKHEDFKCTICHLRFVLATDLQKHDIKNHIVKDNSEYETNKTVEPDPGLFDARCFQCGYSNILFSEEITKECEKSKPVCKPNFILVIRKFEKGLFTPKLMNCTATVINNLFYLCQPIVVFF